MGVFRHRRRVVAFASGLCLLGLAALPGCAGSDAGDRPSDWNTDPGKYRTSLGGDEFFMLAPIYAALYGVAYGGLFVIGGAIAGVDHLVNPKAPPAPAETAKKDTAPRSMRVCNAHAAVGAAACPLGCDYVTRKDGKNFGNLRKCPRPAG